MAKHPRIATLLISSHFFEKSESLHLRVKIVTIFLDSVYWSNMPKNEFLKKCSKVLHMLENDSWWLLLAPGVILRPFGTIWEQLVFWHKSTYTLMARPKKCVSDLLIGSRTFETWKILKYGDTKSYPNLSRYVNTRASGLYAKYSSDIWKSLMHTDIVKQFSCIFAVNFDLKVNPYI